MRALATSFFLTPIRECHRDVVEGPRGDRQEPRVRPEGLQNGSIARQEVDSPSIGDMI